MIEKNFNLDHITGLSDTMFNTIMFNNEDILRNILSLVLDDEIGEIEYLTEYKSALEFVKNHKTLELYLRNSNSYVTIAYYKNYNIAIIYQKLGFNDDGSLIKLDDDIKCAKFIVLDCYKKSYKEKVTAYLRNQYNEILTYKFSYIEFYFKNLLELLNKNNFEKINKFKYLIMLRLSKQELNDFNNKYGDDIVNKYTQQFNQILNDNQFIEVLKEENKKRTDN